MIAVFALAFLVPLVSAGAGETTQAPSVLTCQTNRGENLVQFNGRNQDMYMPCKYWALKRQSCGKYKITLAPGNRWIYPKYQLDTLWLGVINTESDYEWEARTTNKLAVKFITSGGTRDLFNYKGDSGPLPDDLEFGMNEEFGVYIQDKDQTFRVTFSPWDPDNREVFPNAEWKFECFDNTSPLDVSYPDQMCGGSEKRYVMDRAKEVFGLPNRFRVNAIYFDTLTNEGIAQTNPKCAAATNILVNLCPDDTRRINAINHCAQIIFNKRHTQCVTNYNCDPMDVFNACIEWGCTGTGFDKEDEELCKAVAEGIDFCPEFAGSGNLSVIVNEANCYKEFLEITV